MSDSLSTNELNLQRALFYESQYRNAIVSDSISFYDINLTKDLIESDIHYKNDEGKIFSTLDLLGMTSPCSFSLFIKNWIDKMVSKNNLEHYTFLQNVRENLLNIYNEGKREFHVEYWINHDGKKVFLDQVFLLTNNENGDICALSIVKDHTKNRIQEEDSQKKVLEKYAFYDPVTHGYNYIKFKNKLRESNLEGSIISFDIHSFKIINSICGILKGDLVIQKIWEVLVNVFDFDKGDLAGHINADKFIIFVPSYENDVIIRKIKNMTFALNIVSSELSIPQLLPYYGIARWNPEKKIELAYSESVAAKNNASQNEQSINYAFFNENDTLKLIEEKTIIDGFESALAKKEFKLWYQPKFNPVNGKLVGAEALVRWQKEDGSIISPAQFIPIFEKQGLIRRFDEYIFRNVCKHQKIWQKQNKKIVPISINLSRISLYYSNIVNDYKKISDEIGIDTDLLPIEITESAAVTNNEIKDIADNFYNAGFKLHMDDFGSGYSSLASLNTMHFDTLKLDKSLIDYIGNFSGDRLLEHTILLAKELGLHVTAEGVENNTQVSFLKHIGCDSIQGYFYSKPLPKEQFEVFLDSKETDKPDFSYDYLSEHVSKFKNSILKTPLYTFIINLSKNTFYEPTGNADFMNETNIFETEFDKAVALLVDKYICDKYKQAYRNFMDRKRLIESYAGIPETRIIEYNRIYKDVEAGMRLIAHIFKIKDSDDLWMYETVSLQ